MWGYDDAKEVIGKPNPQFWQMEEKAIEIIKNLKRKGGWIGEMTAMRKDGSLFDVELSSSLVKNDDGKPLCIMASFIDITERKKAEETVIRKLKFEKTISDISSRFVNIDDIDKAINSSLTDIGRLSGASRAYLFLLRKDRETIDNTHEWCAKGVKSEKVNLQNLKINNFPWWLKKFSKNEIIHIEDVSKMDKEANAEKEILESQNIKSILCLPLYIKRELSGFIGFDNIKNTGKWGREDYLILRTALEIVENGIEKKRAEEALRKSEEQYRNLVENTGDIPYVLDSNGIFTYIGSQVVKYGFKVSDMKGQNFMKFIYSKDAQNTLKDFKKTMEKGIEMLTTFRVDTPRMGIRYIEESGRILRDDTEEIIGLAGILRDITQRKKAENRLKREAKEALFLSLIDDLTGLYNRRGFMTLAEQQLKISKRTKRDLLVIYIDVDHLKRINDTFGHRVGSLALIETGNILKSSFRKSDILARIGGDEFVVLAIESSKISADIIRNRIQENLSIQNIEVKHPYDYKLSLSIGIIYHNPKQHCTIEDLVEQADKLMYEDKRSKER